MTISWSRKVAGPATKQRSLYNTADLIRQAQTCLSARS